MPGTFITFEGIDGSGKSTQLKLLGNFLRARGCDALLTREPGGTALGLRLRAALLDAMEEVDPLTELLVFAADRAQHVRRVLRPALAAGSVVISDRYADATVAYQGAGRGFPPELIAEIVRLATEGLKPDLTLLFDVSIDESTNRTTRRSSNKTSTRDRLDIEHADFHTRVRDACGAGASKTHRYEWPRRAHAGTCQGDHRSLLAEPRTPCHELCLTSLPVTHE